MQNTVLKRWWQKYKKNVLRDIERISEAGLFYPVFDECAMPLVEQDSLPVVKFTYSLNDMAVITAEVIGKAVDCSLYNTAVITAEVIGKTVECSLDDIAVIASELIEKQLRVK